MANSSKHMHLQPRSHLSFSSLLLRHPLLTQLFQACGKLGDEGGSSRADKIFNGVKVVVDDKMESSTSKMNQLVSVLWMSECI